MQIHARKHTGSGLGREVNLGGVCTESESRGMMGVPSSCFPEEAGQSDQTGRYQATGPLSSLQLHWQCAKMTESGTSGGCLLRQSAARGAGLAGAPLGDSWGGT